MKRSPNNKIYLVVLIAVVIFALVIFTVWYMLTPPTLKVRCINGGDTALGIIKEALKDKYNIKVSEKNYDIILDGVRYQEIDEALKHDKAIKISYVWEATKPHLEVYDLSIGFDFIDDPKYLRIPLYYIYYGDKISTNYDRGQCNPHKKYFACFLVSNAGGDFHPINKAPMDGCKARISMFHKLSLYKRVESGGGHLNNIGGPLSLEEADKWVNQCKFMISFENQSYDGYITEKPFKAYLGGALPLYYADTSALQDINKKAVIYAGDFNSQDDMIEYIKKVDNDDELYCKIWNEKIITNPDKNYDLIITQLREKLLKIITSKIDSK